MDSLQWYQTEASKTINFDLEHRDQELNLALGLCGEAGEIADRFKKVYFQGHHPDRAKVLEELGDALWYIAGQATDHGFSLAEIAEFNIAKLRGRYPNGFNPHDSINRKKGLADEHGLEAGRFENPRVLEHPAEFCAGAGVAEDHAGIDVGFGREFTTIMILAGQGPAPGEERSGA